MASGCSPTRTASDVQLWSRNRLSLTDAYPAVAQAHRGAAGTTTLILDGEATGAWGRQGQADYHVFDVLWLDGRDVRPLPLDERAGVLATLPFRAAGRARDAARRRRAVGARLPRGLGRRHRQAPRLALRARRSKHWLKMKCEASQELVVGGFTDPQGSARRPRRAARRLLRRRRLRLRRQGRHRLRHRAAARPARAARRARDRRRPPFTKRDRPAAAARALGAARDRRAGRRSPSGRAHGKLRHPRLLGVRDRQGRARRGPGAA